MFAYSLESIIMFLFHHITACVTLKLIGLRAYETVLLFPKGDENLLFRGNSFATKAMDYYMKMVGEEVSC